jgi:uncharacterized coiled-coil DUF342 family protein
MAEAMSEERLAQIREMNQIEHVNAEAAKVLLPLQVSELLAEVDWLRTQAAYMREQIEQLAQVTEERKMQMVAYRALADAP